MVWNIHRVMTNLMLLVFTDLLSKIIVSALTSSSAVLLDCFRVNVFRVIDSMCKFTEESHILWVNVRFFYPMKESWLTYCRCLIMSKPREWMVVPVVPEVFNVFID